MSRTAQAQQDDGGTAGGSFGQDAPAEATDLSTSGRDPDDGSDAREQRPD